MGERILPIMATVERTYGLARERASVLKTPLIALAALFAIRFLFQPRVIPGQMPSGGGFALYGLISIIVAVATVGFIVGTHRMVLKSEGQTGLDYFRFDSGTWKYIGYSILFGIVVAVAFGIVAGLTALIGAVGVVLLIIVLIAVVIVGLRLSVFLPGIAIADPSNSLAGAWAATRGNSISLLAGGLLVGVPAGIIAALIGAIFGNSGFIGKLIGAILVGPVQAALVLLGTIFISLAYDRLVRGGGPNATS